MKDPVKTAYLEFTKKFEGLIPWMYNDVKGLVTINIGNLINSSQAALGLAPFMVDKNTGAIAGTSDIMFEWGLVKAHQEMNRMGGGAFASLTKLRLTEEGQEHLFNMKVAENEALLIAAYPDYPNWPCDAQLALHSMAWAMGAAFHFPHFKAAVTADPPDFNVAAGKDGDASKDPSCRGEGWMEDNHLPGPNPANPGLHPRNLANKVLWHNAALVMANPDMYDADTLYYPQALVDADEETA